MERGDITERENAVYRVQIRDLIKRIEDLGRGWP